ncbi:MAG: rod shape-determining protein MreD [Deltaproteobacteria bacterium]|nr:rod shape-determining protein MreD [Deltaproteobacteria bacterium]
MVIFQTAILDHLFFGKVGIELALIFVIYAGLRIRFLPGGILSLIIGYFMDCLTGSISGLHAFTYVVLFFTSKFYFSRIKADRHMFMALFCFVSILFEGVVILLFYKMLSGADVSLNILVFTLPRAGVGAVLCPVLLKIFNMAEVYLGYGNTRPFERA